MSSELLKIYNCYSDLERSPYYVLCFNNISSKIAVEIPLHSNKENTKNVLKILDLNDEFDLIYKYWVTEDSKDSDNSKDYPYEYFYKNIKMKLMIWINTNGNELNIEFQYDGNNLEVENWVLQKMQELRSKLGEEKSPTFNVLTSYGSSFDTEEVKTPQTKLDIENNYNDDFLPIHELIESSINSETSGLILLHGLPGTGKTSYIKGLISENLECNFIFIQNEFVRNLLDPEFISFLLNQRNSILVIEDAEKVITSREDVREESIVSTILQLTDGLFSDYLNIKIICTFNSNLSKVDSALMRKGRMIAKYEFKPLAKEKTEQLLAKMGIKENKEELTLADIFNYNNSNFKDNDKKIGF